MASPRWVVVLVAAALVLPAGAEDGRVFDAEEAVIRHGVVYSDSNALGWQAVGAFGDRAGACIEFVDMPAADRINVHYNNGSGKAQQAGLYIADKRVATLTFEPTDGWFAPFETVSYHGPVSGTVRIQIDAEDFARNGGFACNVDAVSLGSPEAYEAAKAAPGPHDQPYVWPDNQPEECPFPESDEITGVVFTGRYANYTQADTWFPMWAADGACYSPFTDGTVDGYMSVGHYTNMQDALANKNHRTGQARLVGDDPMALEVTALGSMSTNYDNFYPCASVIADGVWYYGHYDAFNETGYFAGWRYSSDWNHFTEEQNYPWTNAYWTCAYDVSEQSRYFDFGVDGEVAPGHIAVNANTLYSAKTGYGWDAALTGDIVREHEVKTIKDFSYCDAPRTFSLDVDNGEFRVLVFIGDRGGVSRDRMSVSAEGVVQLTDITTTPGDPGTEVLPFEFDVTVEDGQLDLLFRDDGGNDPCWVVNALYVRPATDDNFFDEKGKAKFRVPRAVVFGQDNDLSPDGRIYFVSHGYSRGTGTNNWANGDALYLCRVDEGIPNVTDPAKYTFWTGAAWSPAVEDAAPFLEWPDNLGGATITWNPGLEKYILVVHHNAKTGINGCADEHRTILMESDEITGPYKTIHYMTNWGPGSYFGNIPAKWISKDGKTAWLVIAANCWGEPANPRQNVYACSMHEFRFVTADEE